MQKYQRRKKHNSEKKRKNFFCYSLGNEIILQRKVPGIPQLGAIVNMRTFRGVGDIQVNKNSRSKTTTSDV